MTNKIAQISEKGYNFLLDSMCFTTNGDHQNFIVFDPMLSFVILDSNKKVIIGYQKEHNSKQLSHLKLILKPPCLI